MVYDNKMEIHDNLYPFITQRTYLFFILFAFLVQDLKGCKDIPVGIADSSIIPDDRFTASSQYDHRYVPKNARLNGARGWAPKTTTDPNEYLQIDLGQVFVICAVATQGYGVQGYDERTEQYKISTSVNNVNWTTLKNGSTDKLFPGNTDRSTVVKNALDYPVLVRFIRFIPTTYNSWKALRVEAYGFGKDYSFLPIGIASGKIPDSDMTSSSSYNSTTSPSKARLNYTAGSSWCSTTSDSSPYLQINLGLSYIICGIATQGDHMTDQWVQSYNMLTSNDGSTFTKYMSNSQVKSFAGNFDPNTAVKNLLYDVAAVQYIRVAPTSHYGITNCMRTELYGIKQNGGCTAMFVGLSYSSMIPDHRFTASSSYSAKYIPSNARLKAHLKAWAPQAKVGPEWLQIDLGYLMIVCAVATQGTGYPRSEWVTTYKIRVSLNNVNWIYYQENNIDKTFTGNTNKDDIVKSSLSIPIKAKFIRFYPSRFHVWPTMRVEVYGLSTVCSSPVGLEVPGVIQNSQMTSSSHLDNNHTASDGRLYGNSAWCSRLPANTEYIQINLTQVMTVTGIASQGDHTMNKWAWTYTISYSMDGSLWNTYKAGSNSDKIFQGNIDKESVRMQWLSHPVTARHVRVTPQTWNTGICMRIELYGCEYATRPVISGLTNQNLTPPASNSFVDLMCIVQEPLIQYIKWYTGNTDITSQSTGLVRGGNGVKQSTLRVNYTTAAHVLNAYNCFSSKFSLWCSKPFTCRAMYGKTNIDADGLKSAEVKVRYDYPSTQPKPTVKFRSSTVVGIVWQKLPLNKFQKPVTSYVLVYNNDTFSKTITMSALSLVITGLEIYSSYNIKTKAVSIVGDGKWSQPLSVRTDSLVPTGFPTSIRAVALTSQSLRVTWQTPTSGINGPFLGYRVFCISGSDRREISATPRQTSHTFSGLRKWTVYNVTVVVRNDKGEGPINAYVIRRTLEDVPGQPQLLQVTVLSSTGVRLTWALPSETNGIIRGFKLLYEKAGNSSKKNFPGKTTLSYLLNGLDKCTQYSFKILAYTISDGPYTSLIQKTTAEDAPSAPTNLLENIIQPNSPSVPQVTLAWSKPVVCGDNVRYYKVSYNHDEDPTFKVETVNKNKLTVTIPVWGGVTYGFRVRGVTSKEGPDTPTKRVVIPVYVPSVSPSNVTLGDVNRTTFRVSWNKIPRSKSNGVVFAYEVNQTLVRRGRARRSIDAVGQVNMMNSSCCSLNLYDLLVCAEYHISIKGYTSAGAGPSSDIKSLETSVPGPPVELDIQTTKKREISLTWQKPESVTEAIETYTILFEGKKDYNSSFLHTGSLSLSSTTKEVTNLYPGTRYTFRVSATTACGKGDNSLPSSSTTKIDAPPAPVVGLVGNITAEVITITLWESADINGQIEAYQLIVVRVDETSSSLDERKLKSYEEAKKEELNYYIAAEIKADGDKKFPRVFILGDEKEYNGYKNVKISYGKTYNVLQRALTQDEKKEYLAGPSTLIARGKVLDIKESCSGKHSQMETACLGLDSSVFAVSLAFNLAFFIIIVLVVGYNRKLKKQLDEMKKAKSRPGSAFTQDIYSVIIANSSGEGLPMASLTAQAGSTYEQIDLHGTVDPSDVQTEVTSSNTIATDTVGEIYESINEESKSNPNLQIYETIQPKTLSQNPENMVENDTVSSSQPTYQSLIQENQTKPVYESLHT